MPQVDILLPTYNRLSSLILTLSGVAAQTLSNIHLIVADQSDEPVAHSQVIQTLRRIIEARGGSVAWHTRPQVHGIAEQRDFLLQQATSNAVLYLDDDVFMEPWVLAYLLHTLDEQRCGFVGAFPAGLSHRSDVRPQQQNIEYWEARVQPEIVEPDSPQWERWQLHRAANLYHVAQSLPRAYVGAQFIAPATFAPTMYSPAMQPRLYKVAWVASCILYDHEKLLEVGGFSFWPRLPRFHSGEEVLVQNLLMRLWGGCAIIPSGTYYSQVPTTVLNAAGTVDGHALALLPEMVKRYAPKVE